MGEDLFGNEIKEKRLLTTMNRIVTRQADIEGRDLYTTDPKDIERFLLAAKDEGLEIIGPIWEAAAGHGDISKTLIQYGYDVVSTDIIPYKDNEIDIPAMDFFTCENLIRPDIKTIFTNPPFNEAENFLIHALSFGIDIIFFVRMSFLSSKTRKKIFDVYKPTFTYIYAGRAKCYKNGDRSKDKNMIDYVVMIWKPPYKTKPIMEWIE